MKTITEILVLGQLLFKTVTFQLRVSQKFSPFLLINKMKPGPFCAKICWRDQTNTLRKSTRPKCIRPNLVAPLLQCLIADIFAVNFAKA
jgi:hypothetical protein